MLNWRPQQRGRIDTKWDSNRLLKDLITKDYKNVVNKEHQNIFNVIFRVPVHAVRVVDNKVRSWIVDDWIWVFPFTILVEKTTVFDVKMSSL
jgi:hypothetical protein